MTVVLKGQDRKDFGSKTAKNIRKSGYIPAIIYGKEGNVNLAIPAKEFEKEYFKGNLPATIIEVEVDSKKLKVISHDISLDPVTDRPIHVDFISCDDSQEVRAKPKITFVGKDKSPGIKKGGFLHVALRRAEILCSAKVEVPVEIEVNVKSLHLSSKVRANDITLPEGVRFIDNNNFLICSVIGRGKSTAEDKAAEGGDVEAGEDGAANEEGAEGSQAGAD